MASMEEWVKQGFLREIEIRSHCHGYRVSLRQGCKEITTSIQESIQQAFDVCIKDSPEAEKRILAEEIKQNTKSIIETTQNLRKLKLQGGNLKKDLSEK